MSLSSLIGIVLLLGGCSKPEVGSDGSLHRPGPFFGSRSNNAPASTDVSSASKTAEPDKPPVIDSDANLHHTTSYYSTKFGSVKEALPSIAKPPDAILPFTLNFPGGYQSFTSRNYAAQTFFFSGTNRKDGSHPSFIISLIPKQKGQQLQDTPESALSSSLAEIRKTKSNWSAQTIEEVTISGLSFLCQRWGGFDKNVNSKMAGVFYLGRSGDCLILFGSQDRADHQDSLALAEYAFSTFQLAKE